MAPINSSSSSPGPVVTAVLCSLVILSTVIACLLLKCGSHCSQRLTRVMYRLVTWDGHSISPQVSRERQRRSREERSPVTIALLPLQWSSRRHREQPSGSPAPHEGISDEREGETMLSPIAPMPARGPRRVASVRRAEEPPSYSAVQHQDRFTQTLDNLPAIDDIPHLQLPAPAYQLGSFRNGWFVLDPPSPNEAAPPSPAEIDVPRTDVAIAMLGVDMSP